MQKIAFITAAIIGAASFTPAVADDATGKSAISAEISTTGVGVDYIYGISPNLHLRASVNGGQLSYDFEGDDNNGQEGDELQYEGDLNLFSIGGTADWYPTGGWFRLSAGLFFSDNNASGSATCESASGSCEFGDDGEEFNRQQLGTVEADVEFNPIAPYVGVGFGNPLKKQGWGFSGDIGLLIQGSADVELRSQGDCSAVPPFNIDCTAERDAALEEEEREIEEDVKALQAYPVINLALTYRF